jgi:hypothetical protein
MADLQTKIGQTTAEFMEFLEKEYSDDDTAVVKEVMVVALVETENDPDTGAKDDNGFSVIHWRASEKIWSHKRGLVQAVVKSLDRGYE